MHAEGDGLPGLVIDRFGDTLTVQIGTAGMEAADRRHDPVALDIVLKPKTIILRNDAPSRALEGLDSYVKTAKGDGHRIAVEENGARYIADLAEGQKTGWYYDQRDNRAFIAGFAKGKTRAGRLFLYRRLRHPGGQGRRQGSRVPGLQRAGAGALPRKAPAPMA